MPARADVIQTKDGARLVGKITSVNAGTVSMDTKYAGTLLIKQSEVVSIQTDAPSSIRLSSGTRLDGTVTTTPAGAVQVAGPEGTVTTSVANLAMVWPVGAVDPLAGAWAYEAALSVAGASGNKTSLDTGGSFKAELVRPSEALKFFGHYDRAVTEGVKSADQLALGIDYSKNFTADQQWFVRDTGGFDRVMDIRYQDVAAGGYGFDFIKTPKDVLLARVGVAYRYTDYINSGNPNVSAASADIEIAHDYKNSFLEVNNGISFVPELQHFDNFIITHDSYVQLPLTPIANLNLKLRAEIENNYNSRPGAGIKKMDTLYSLRLVYDFGAAAPAAP